MGGRCGEEGGEEVSVVGSEGGKGREEGGVAYISCSLCGYFFCRYVENVKDVSMSWVYR